MRVFTSGLRMRFRDVANSALCVHSVDGLLVDILYDLPLDFEGRCDQARLRGPDIRHQGQGLRHFKLFQAFFEPVSEERVEYRLLDVGVVHHLLVGDRLPQVVRHRLQVRPEIRSTKLASNNQKQKTTFCFLL